MNLRIKILAVLIAAAAALCGCGLGDGGIDEVVPCRATGLEVADTTAAGSNIIVRITGAVGPSGCYHLEGIERCRMGRRWILRPLAHHYEEEHWFCTGMVVPLDETVYLEPADTGWTWIEVRSLWPLLVDSTYVQPAP